MKTIALYTAIIFFAALQSHVHAQSINNKIWSAYLDAPINDTVTFHFQSDSSFLTNSKGDVVIRMKCIIAGDSLTIVNKDADEHGCPDEPGKYKITFIDDGFRLTTVEDSCEGRAHALDGVKWHPAKK